MLVVARIEMWAGGFERRLALADRMDVERVLAGRQALDRDLEQDAGRRLRQVDVADRFAAGVLQLRAGKFGVGGQRDGRDQQGGGGGRA